MKNLRVVGMASIFMIGFSAIFVACEKSDGGDDNSNETTELRVFLTDNPIDELDEVNVDIQEINVHIKDDDNIEGEDDEWLSIGVNEGVYNLLDYQQGVDTLIGFSTIPATHIQEIRLVLGENNSVVDTLGQEHSLTIPSGQSSGLKIKVNRVVEGPIDTMLIDFDAALSVKKEPSGYKLRPVIKLKD